MKQDKNGRCSYIAVVYASGHRWEGGNACMHRRMWDFNTSIETHSLTRFVHLRYHGSLPLCIWHSQEFEIITNNAFVRRGLKWMLVENRMGQYTGGT